MKKRLKKLSWMDGYIQAIVSTWTNKSDSCTFRVSPSSRRAEKWLSLKLRRQDKGKEYAHFVSALTD